MVLMNGETLSDVFRKASVASATRRRPVKSWWRLRASSRLAVPFALALGAWGCSDTTAPAPSGPSEGEPSAGAATSDPEAAAAPRSLDRIGIQLFTLRAEAAQDLEGTLRRVAELGYDEVEFAGLFGNDPVRVRELLDELGLVAVANHVSWEIIRVDPARGIEETRLLGAEYMVFAWLPPHERATLSQWRDWIERLNDVGRACRDADLRFAYHNHDFEFEAIDGEVPYSLLLDGLDPELVELELDFYWLATAGREPFDLFESQPGRFPLSHVKDMDPSDQSMADVGQGSLDFGAAFAQMERSGMRHFFVEHDVAADPWRTAEVSLRYLRQLTF